MIIIGAGGHAKVIIEILESMGVHSFRLWDGAVKPPIFGIEVEQPSESVDDKEEMIIAIGVNATRKRIANEWQSKVTFGRAIHKATNISARTQIGPGTVVMAGVTINANTLIGDHCIINTNASVDHDCLIGDFVHISPNASLCGGVGVGVGTHVGAGATVIPGIKIGAWCTIGAGAVIIRDIPDGATVVGNPGRIIKTKELASNE